MSVVILTALLGSRICFCSNEAVKIATDISCSASLTNSSGVCIGSNSMIVNNGVNNSVLGSNAMQVNIGADNVLLFETW